MPASVRVLGSFSFEQITEDSPLWFRGLASDIGPEAEAHAAALCAKFGVARIVIGHTPTGQHIVRRLSGRVMNGDVGLSRSYGPLRDALLYEHGEWFSLPDGGEKKLP